MGKLSNFTKLHNCSSNPKIAGLFYLRHPFTPNKLHFRNPYKNYDEIIYNMKYLWAFIYFQLIFNRPLESIN